MYTPYRVAAYQPYPFTRNRVVLDKKHGDVTGDGKVDLVYLIGNKDDPASEFADHIALVIQDGLSGKSMTVNFPNDAGYNARLFLGDFDKDKIPDILVSIDSGGSGGYGYFYVYSFKNNRLHKLFDVDSYNSEYTFLVSYEDRYKVSVSSPKLDVLFLIDISDKGYDYLSQFYNDDGKLKKPVQGGALALGGLSPIVTNDKATSYNLLAVQRIIGTTNADTLGYVNNLLTWSGSQFLSSQLLVSILGTPLSVLL